MTQNTYPFNSRDTYKDFVKETKKKVEVLIEEIREEKVAIKENQRLTDNANVSYKKLLDIREKIKETQDLRSKAKIEASRQYVRDKS